jgi:hypothetical protein
MLVIHVVKMLHAHPVPVAAKHKYTGNAEQVVHQHAAHCKICDFQLARDADVTVASFHILIQQPIAGLYAYYAGFPYRAHAAALCLRGPPSFC